MAEICFGAVAMSLKQWTLHLPPWRLRWQIMMPFGEK